MPLDLVGKLIMILPEQTGQGQNGNWLKQSFVIETQDQYPKKVSFIAWNDKAEILKNLKAGDELKVAFNLESREYNGKWYTDAKAWRIEKVGAGAEDSTSDFVPDRTSSFQDIAPINDDLPF